MSPLVRSIFSRSLLPTHFTALRSQSRSLTTTSLLRTSAGYGDPQDEKIQNKTPLGKSSTDPERKKGRTETIPTNQGDGGESTKPTKSTSSKGSVGSAGGKKGAGDKGKEQVSGQEIRETKKIGEEPKKTAEGAAGPKGG